MFQDQASPSGLQSTGSQKLANHNTKLTTQKFTFKNATKIECLSLHDLTKMRLCGIYTLIMDFSGGFEW